MDVSEAQLPRTKDGVTVRPWRRARLLVFTRPHYSKFMVKSSKERMVVGHAKWRSIMLVYLLIGGRVLAGFEG